jgi:hypothetical protein
MSEFDSLSGVLDFQSYVLRRRGNSSYLLCLTPLDMVVCASKSRLAWGGRPEAEHDELRGEVTWHTSSEHKQAPRTLNTCNDRCVCNCERQAQCAQERMHALIMYKAVAASLILL